MPLKSAQPATAFRSLEESTRRSDVPRMMAENLGPDLPTSLQVVPYCFVVVKVGRD